MTLIRKFSHRAGRCQSNQQPRHASDLSAAHRHDYRLDAVCRHRRLRIVNGIVAVFVIMAIRGFVRGEPNQFFSALMVPFAIAGICLIVYLVRQIMISTGVGATRLEISHHPLTHRQGV